MIANEYGLGVLDNSLVFKELPSSDAEVSDSDTFVITFTGDGLIIQPYINSYQISYLGVDSSSTSVSLIHSSDQNLENKVYWTVDKYTGSHQAGVLADLNKSLVAGNTVTVSPRGWSTYVGYNSASMTMDSGYEDIATYSDGDSGNIILTLHQEGVIRLNASMLLDGSSLTETIELNITLPYPESVYYIKSNQQNLYLNSNSYDEIVVSAFDFDNTTKWRLIHIEDGYYKIVNAATLDALSLSSNGNIVPDTYASGGSMDWKIVMNGDHFVLKPRENEYNYMSVYVGDQPGIVLSEYPVTSVTHSNNSLCDGLCKWYLCNIEGSEVVLLGINDGDLDIKQPLGDIMTKLSSKEMFDYDLSVRSYVTVSEYQSKLENSKIFVSICHGNANSYNTFINLRGTGTSEYLYPHDIYDYDTNTPVVDLSNCELIIFVSCHAGKDDRYNLVDAAIAAGAKAVIGFEDEIYNADAIKWLDKFFEVYAVDGNTVEDAKAAAEMESYEDNSIVSSCRLEIREA